MTRYREAWIACPRCSGQTYDVGTCGLCGDVGVLDGDGDPLTPEQVRRAISWLHAWQVNFDQWVSETEPIMPSGPFGSQRQLT